MSVSEDWRLYHPDPWKRLREVRPVPVRGLGHLWDKDIEMTHIEDWISRQATWERRPQEVARAEEASRTAWDDTVATGTEGVLTEGQRLLRTEGATTNDTPAPEGRKDDAGKDRWDLLPFDALTGVARVLTYGAKKYGENSWRGVTQGRARYAAALLRHLAAWSLGERVDPESGLPHLAHAATNALFLLALDT